jgi:hypothetical protein
MKIILTENQMNKIYFKYLDLLMKHIDLNFLKSDKQYKVFYNGDVRTFTYSVRSEDVYFLESVVRDFHSMFSDLEWTEVLHIVGKWIEYKFGYPVRSVYSVQRMSEN